MTVTKMQIPPVIVNGFENGFHRWIQRIFLVVVEVKKILRFFSSGYAHDRNVAIFRRRASTVVTGNTLILPIYGSVRQSRDSLHRDRHTLIKKSRSGAVLSNRLS